MGAHVRGNTCAKYFAAVLSDAVARNRGSAWPSIVYANDPEGFVRDVLHEVPLPHQVEVLNAVRDNFRTAVRSGQKTGKTKLVIWLALWWYCTRPEGRVIMLAAIKDQVERVLWKELKSTLITSRRCAACRKAKSKAVEVCPHGFEILEKVPKNPTTGIISAGVGLEIREIRGITAREVEALAGISGELLFIVDEASQMPKPVAEALEGNLMGAGSDYGRMVWISNPTRTDGPFYEVFNNPDVTAHWSTFHLSSEVVAEYQHDHGTSVKGLATRQTVNEFAEEKGRDSDFFIMRVLGEFLRNETGRIFSLGDLELSNAAWPDAPELGELRIGVDPAGPGDGGDRYGICVVRGKKVLWLEARQSMTEEDAIEHIRSLLKIHRRGDEIPWVIADVEGPIGSSLGYRLTAIGQALRSKRPADSFEFLGVKASHNASRDPRQYERVREELWASGVAWVRDGGALLPDHELESELHAPMWSSTVTGKLKVTPKSELRTALGGSTDKADAFLLAVWQPFAYARAPEQPDVAPDRQGVPDNRRSRGADEPYAGRPFDPYASFPR